MNKAIAFALLDFRLIKPYVKTMLMLLLIGAVMGYFFKSPSTLSSYFMMMLILVINYPFAIAEKNGMDALYGTLSIGRGTVVAGRYLFVLALEIVCAAVTFGCSWALAVALGMAFDAQETLFTICVCSGLFSLVVALQYPLYFKFGYNKAKMIALVPLFVVFIVILQLPVLSKLMGGGFTWEAAFRHIEDSLPAMYGAPILLGLILLALSCALSRGIYAGKDI